MLGVGGRNISEKEIMTIDVDYMGLIANLTGKDGERFELTEGSSLDDLLNEFLHQYPSFEKDQKSLLFVVNKKAVTTAKKSWNLFPLSNGDQVIIGVKIIGG